MAKAVEVHLNDILRLHFASPLNDKKSYHKFSIDMLVVYYDGVFLLINLETGVFYAKFPHTQKWTIRKLKLYLNQNRKELLPIEKIEPLGQITERL